MDGFMYHYAYRQAAMDFSMAYSVGWDSAFDTGFPAVAAGRKYYNDSRCVVCSRFAKCDSATRTTNDNTASARSTMSGRLKKMFGTADTENKQSANMFIVDGKEVPETNSTLGAYRTLGELAKKRCEPLLPYL